MTAPKYNFGNYPNSANYDPNIPIGQWKWDDDDCYDGNDEIDTEFDEPENEAEEREEEQ